MDLQLPGSMMPAADNSENADKAFAAAAKSQSEQSTGTDTGSGDREVTRVAQTDGYGCKYENLGRRKPHSCC